MAALGFPVCAVAIACSINVCAIAHRLRRAGGVVEIPNLDAPGIVQAIPVDPTWAHAVYTDGPAPNYVIRGRTHSGAEYDTLNGVFKKIYDPNDSGNSFQLAKTPRQALQQFVARCLNNFQDAIQVIFGNSITWGSAATARGPSEPRDHRLTDPRTNLTCRSYVNLFREYVGRTYLDIPWEEMPVEETAPGAVSGGSGSYSRPVFAVFYRSSEVKVYDASGVEYPGNGIQTATPALADKALSLPPGHALDVLVNSDTFNIVFKAVATSEAKFSVYVDSIHREDISTYSASAQWATARPFTLPVYKLSRLRIVNTSAGVPIYFEGLARTKVIRIINQGISGTSTSGWIPDPATNGRILLRGAFPTNTSDIMNALGTNNRTRLAADPMPTYGTTRFHQEQCQIIEYLQERFPHAPIQLLGGMTTPDDDVRVFGQRALINDLHDLSERYDNVSLLNLYPILQRAIQSRPNGAELIFPDRLHPSDLGMGIITNEGLIPYAERTFSR